MLLKNVRVEARIFDGPTPYVEFVAPSKTDNCLWHVKIGLKDPRRNVKATVVYSELY